jgi:hypothetical protein
MFANAVDGFLNYCISLAFPHVFLQELEIV